MMNAGSVRGRIPTAVSVGMLSMLMPVAAMALDTGAAGRSQPDEPSVSAAPLSPAERGLLT